MKRAVYTNPSIPYYPIYRDMADQTHLLIAGTTGSGKSTIIKGILNAILMHSPATAQLILIDPKKVELDPYKSLPHVIQYADTQADAVSALKYASRLQNARYSEMKSQGLRQSDRPHVYIIIDELADLILKSGNDVLPLLQGLSQLGRAANIHIIAATQAPSRKVLPAEIMVNMTAQIALRCRSAIESRQIIGIAGAEELPKHGEAIYYTPDRLEPILLTLPPPKQEEYLNQQVTYWLNFEPEYID